MADTGNIHERLVRVAQSVGAVAKGRQVDASGVKYAFRGIDDLQQATQPAFVEHGVTCLPRVLSSERHFSEGTNKYGNVISWTHVFLTVEYVFSEPGGTTASAIVCGEGLDSSDKATAKALSMALKYALIQALDIPTADAEDGDATRPEVERQRQPLADAARKMGLRERLNDETNPWQALPGMMREHKLSSEHIKAITQTFSKAAVEAWLEEPGHSLDLLIEQAVEFRDSSRG